MPHPQSVTVRLDRVDGHLRARAYEVQVVSGADVGKKLKVDGTVRVGTHPDAQLKLSDASVGKLHVELSPRAGGIWVRDLDSKNGTWIGKSRIKEAMVEEGLTLELGHTQLKVSAVEQDLGVPPAKRDFGGLLGKSEKMQKLFGVLERVAGTSSTVVFQGERGTGKHAAALALHRASTRARAPFVVIRCHDVGVSVDPYTAFTEADGGTLLLDEIGDLPLDQQPRLLRAIESGTVKRPGEDAVRQVDVRLVATTNRDLVAETDRGRFRKDLYFRLAVVMLELPPLRERLEDLPLLCTRFLQELGCKDFDLSPSLLHRFQQYDWPGNVRELRTVLERALAVESETPPSEPVKPERLSPQAEELVDALTREFLAMLYRRNKGNVSAVARDSGFSRTQVARLLAKFGIEQG